MWCPPQAWVYFELAKTGQQRYKHPTCIYVLYPSIHRIHGDTGLSFRFFGPPIKIPKKNMPKVAGDVVTGQGVRFLTGILAGGAALESHRFQLDLEGG